MRFVFFNLDGVFCAKQVASRFKKLLKKYWVSMEWTELK